MKKIIIDRKTDCLLVTDVQNDFCPGGALGVSGGDKIVGPINKILKKFGRIAACQDWHPRKHCSFRERGGPWRKQRPKGRFDDVPERHGQRNQCHGDRHLFRSRDWRRERRGRRHGRYPRRHDQCDVRKRQEADTQI